MNRAWLAATLMLLLSGCGDDDATDAGLDGSADARPDGGDLSVVMPAAPMPPVLTPCPDGYREVVADGALTCDPWPESGRDSCAIGEAHFPGTPACAVVGADCPADGLPTAGSIFVSEGATGDGTRADPFGSLAEAVSAASSGDTIAVGVGTYGERVSLPGGVELAGACTSGVRIFGIDVAGADSTIRDVTLGGGSGSGVTVTAAGSVTMTSVVVDTPTSAGVDVRGGALVATDLAINDVVGVDTADGCGVGVYDGGTADITRLVVARARADGVYVTGAGSAATLADASVFDIAPNAIGEGGRGIAIFSGGSLSLTRAVVEGARSIGVLVRNRATATLEDVVVRDTLPRESDEDFGRAISALGAATVTATRFFAENNHDVGVFAEGDGTVVTLRDAVVRDMRSEASDGSTGKAAQAQFGAQMTLVRVLFARARDAALVSHGELTLVDATDVTIVDTLDQEIEPRGGWGAAVQFGGELRLTRVHIEGCSEIGVYASGRMTSLFAEDLTILDTGSLSVDGTQGRGLNVQLVATADIRRVLVSGSHEAGVLAIGTLTQVTAEDLTIRDTSEEQCSVAGCPTNASNLGSYDEAEIDVSRFAFSGAEVCGVWLDEGGGLDLRQGEVTSSRIGACVLDEGFDLERIQDRVRYEDNGTNLDSPALPVPATIDDIPI